MWYISFWEQNPGRSALLFGTFVIVFNFLLPISLYVSLEIVRIFHALFIQWDKDMYYAEIDVPARTNNSNLCDELGQVDMISVFLFSIFLKKFNLDALYFFSIHDEREEMIDGRLLLQFVRKIKPNVIIFFFFLMGVVVVDGGGDGEFLWC